MKAITVCREKVKVLPMDNYLADRCRNSDFFGKDVWYYYEDSDYERIAPVFNRNGRYYDRINKHVWEECDGRAYLEAGLTSFQYRLSIENHAPLGGPVRKAIRTLIIYGRCPAELKSLVYLDDQVIALRDTRWHVELFTLNSLKKKKKKKRK